MKTDLKVEWKELFTAPRDRPVLVDVPAIEYLAVDGQGEPGGGTAFEEAIQALYSVAYSVKFDLKKQGALDFTVMPLEALWWSEDGAPFDMSDPESVRWRAMIAQPIDVTPEIAQEAVASVWKRHQLPALWEVRLETFHEGLCAQIMHLGPYSAEGPTIERLHGFIRDEGYEPWGKHHEIYLGDPRRAAPEKLRTIIRQPVSLA